MNVKYMKRAIELAKKGTGYTSPNPLVGAVIVKDDRIIGQGYHESFGGPHAEVNAFNSLREDPKDATMYVTLEPCSHYGKTPPCTEAIIKSGISKVVIGMKDPNPLVAGKGISILEKNGIEVICEVLEYEVKKINEIFIKYITTKRPFCILKTAMTLDGKIATRTGDSKWITNEDSRKYVHQIRHKASGIMVGIGTVLVDNPSLTTRLEGKMGKDAVRIIVDTRARIPLKAKVLNLSSQAKTIIATTDKSDKNKRKALEVQGAEILITPFKNNKVDLDYLMKKLGEKGIDSILLEGGSTLNYSALQQDIVDKIIYFISPKIVGGKSAITSVGGEGKKHIEDALRIKDIRICRFNEDIMVEGYLDKGE